jgi:hypothetical protein
MDAREGISRMLAAVDVGDSDDTRPTPQAFAVVPEIPASERSTEKKLKDARALLHEVFHTVPGPVNLMLRIQEFLAKP